MKCKGLVPWPGFFFACPETQAVPASLLGRPNIAPSAGGKGATLYALAAHLDLDLLLSLAAEPTPAGTQSSRP